MALGMNEKRARSILAKTDAAAAKDYFAQRVDGGWVFSPPLVGGRRPTGTPYLVCDNGLSMRAKPGQSTYEAMAWLAAGAGQL